jgi:Family of unknown function (DUF6335)
MARAKATRRKKPAPAARSRRSARRPKSRQAKRSAKRPTKSSAKRASVARKAKPAKPAKAAKAAKPARRAKPVKAVNVTKAKAATPRTAAPARAARTKTPAMRKKSPRLDRVRRTLEEADMVPMPPSSLNMDRHGSAARTGRAEMEQSRLNHAGMGQDITGGDSDVDVEDAYFTGDEAPGGDNPSPDQDIVEDIGKALGVQYDDNEELKGSDKIIERDKHRWEMDPASSEDYKDRK